MAQSVFGQVAREQAHHRSVQGIGQLGRQGFLQDADGQEGDAEDLAADDVDRAAHGQGGLRAMLVQVDGDLAPRVAQAHHQHALPLEAGAIGVGRAVQHRPLEGGQARPGGTLRLPVVASGHDQRARTVNRVLGMDLPAGFGSARPDDFLPIEGLDLVMARVGVQVVHHLLARGIAGVGLGEIEEWQGGVGLVGVQVQPAVVPHPGRAHVVVLFQHDAGHPLLLQASRHGQARRASAHHDHGRCVHRRGHVLRISWATRSPERTAPSM